MEKTPTDNRLTFAAHSMWAAIDQALDDMGETGHCVSESTKRMLSEALKKTEEPSVS